MPAPHAKKLLLFTTDLHRGGTPTVIRDLAIHLSSRGHQVEVACLDRLGVTGQELLSANIPVHPLNITSTLALPLALLRLRSLVRRQNGGGYDRILSFLVHANATAAITAFFDFSDTCWFQSIQTTQPKPAWHWPLQGLAAKMAERVIVPSLSVATAAKQRAGLTDKEIAIIPNAIDLEPFAAIQRDPTKPITRIGFLGRLDPIKRIPDLLTAAKNLPHLTFHIYGDGPERNHLYQLAAGANNITFHGEVKSPLDALKNIDALVLPSQAEGFGLVLIEAMAATIPIIASRAPGIIDVATHNQNALLYPTADTNALTQAITQLTANPTLAQTLTANALSHVTQNYTYPPILAAYERVLRL